MKIIQFAFQLFFVVISALVTVFIISKIYEMKLWYIITFALVCYIFRKFLLLQK